MTILPFRDHAYMRFISGRPRETLFETTMLDGSITVWGKHYRPNEFCARLADDGESRRLGMSCNEPPLEPNATESEWCLERDLST